MKNGFGFVEKKISSSGELLNDLFFSQKGFVCQDRESQVVERGQLLFTSVICQVRVFFSKPVPIQITDHTFLSIQIRIGTLNDAGGMAVHGTTDSIRALNRAAPSWILSIPKKDP